MSDYFGYRTGIKGTIHIKHTLWGSFIEKGISPLNFIEKQYALGNIKPTYPLPVIACKASWFPRGNPFRPPGPYINLLGYNGKEGFYGPGYYVVHCWRVK